MSVTYVESKPNSKFDRSWSSYSTSSRISSYSIRLDQYSTQLDQYSPFSSKIQILDSRLSRILGHYSTPNKGRISNIFQIARRGQVIRRSLHFSLKCIASCNTLSYCNKQTLKPLLHQPPNHPTILPSAKTVQGFNEKLLMIKRSEGFLFVDFLGLIYDNLIFLEN